MQNIFDVDAWDVLTIALVKASAGNTNANFRCIMLDMIDGKWLIRFLIFSDNDELRGVIRDISTEFFSYGEDYGVLSSLDEISSDEISIGSIMPDAYHARATVVFSIAD